MAFDNQTPQILTAAELWEIDDTPERTIDIPEWNNRSVRVRGLTLEQIANVTKRATIRDSRTNVEEQDRALLAAYTLIEGLVEPKLQITDVARLRTRSATAITRIVQAISSLGATEEAVREGDKSSGNGLDAPLSILPRPATGHDKRRAIAADVGS